MNKFTQRDLLNEGLWDKFKNSKVAALGRGVAETGRQVAKVVAPEVYEPLAKAADWGRKAKASIQDKKLPWPKRIERWVKEQGKFPISQVKTLGKYPDGSQHFAVDISEKGIERKSGNEVAGKLYKDPHSVVAYNPAKDQYRWIIKPRTDSYQRVGGRIRYGNENARRMDDDIPMSSGGKKKKKNRNKV